jgi:hypothetical protein
VRGGQVSAPVQVTAAAGVTNLSAGNVFTCGINGSGQAICWGRNNLGQLGRGTTSNRETPGPVAGLTDVIDVDASKDFACAVKSDGTVWCWGVDGDGQLGNGTSVGSSTTPTQVVNLSNAVEISLNNQTVCARLQTGEVWCWGSMWSGATGSSTASFGATHVPLQTDTLDDAQELFAGGAHTCTLRASGGLWCWGKGATGQLGTGLSSDLTTPAEILFYSSHTVVDASGGNEFGCVLLDTGRVYCSGEGDNSLLLTGIRMLGDNQHADGAQNRLYPTPVATIAPIDDELNLCRDGLDNDGQGGVDCADPDCATDLGSRVGQAVHIGFFDGDEGNHFVGSCGTNTLGREHVFTWTAPSSGNYTLTTEGSDLSTVLYVLSTCDESASSPELACDFDSAADGRSSLTLGATAGTTYVIVVDSLHNAGLKSYVLNINN